MNLREKDQREKLIKIDEKKKILQELRNEKKNLKKKVLKCGEKEFQEEKQNTDSLRNQRFQDLNHITKNKLIF